MDLSLVLEQRAKVEEFTRKHRIGLLTLLFTDLVGSTKLKQELGDHGAVSLIQQHHALVRELLRHFPEGEEIGTAGDSFFIVFAKPSDAVQFSLLLQAGLRNLSVTSSRTLLDRVGIHIGEVVIEERPGAPKPKDMYCLQVDICARVMSLADGDQIVLTRSAFDNARQVLKGEAIEGVSALSWLNHGPYVLKGVEEPMEICEVGETGQAILKPPPDSEKVHRYVSPDAEPVLGWRPAINQAVPGTSWVLGEKLGEGGFGEVWLGRHKTTKEQRVFKFCFRADRVRSLKREVTLFRVMKERLGEHPHIVGVQDVYLEEAPYYLTMEYVAGRDLKTWCEANGGVGAIPLETRLEIVAQVAEALQAAHDAGVIHRDVKPSNILVERRESKDEVQNNKAQRLDFGPSTLGTRLTVKLTDFGIGQVVSEEVLAGVTRLGFTQTIISPGTSAQTGTQLYMAPELLAGNPATIRSDIYSLGVVLFQLLAGDLSRPVTTDWAKDVSDPLLREDLELCFSGDPQGRFVSAAELAVNLRSLLKRHEALAQQKAEAAARERAAYRRGMIRTASFASLIIALTGGLAIFSFSVARKEKRERTAAQRSIYIANMNMAQLAWEQDHVGRVRQLLEETATYPERGFEWYYWQRQTHLELKTLRGHGNIVQAVAFSPDGHRIVTGSQDSTAKVWDADNGKELLTINGQRDNPIYSVAFSSDGQRIITASGKTVKVWDAANSKDILTLEGDSRAVWSVAFSPDGRRFVTGGKDKTATIWEAATGKKELTLRLRHTDEVESVAFSPDGQRIVTGSYDRTAKVWDATSGRELLTLKGHNDGIRSASFSPNGQQIVTGSLDKTAKLWEAGTGKELVTLKGHSGWISSVAFSSDGQRIVTGSYDATAKVWEVASGKELATLKGHNEGINSVAYSPDGLRIVTGSIDTTAKVWDSRNSLEPRILEGQKDPIGSAAFSPDCKRIVTGSVLGSENWTARICEVASGKELLILKGHSSVVSSVAFSSDGQRIVTGSDDKTAKVWDATSGKELFTLKGYSGFDGDGAVAVSPDGERIVTSGEGTTAKVWEMVSGKEILTLNGNLGYTMSISISPDIQRIVIGNTTGAKVWDTKSGKELFALKGYSASVMSVAFSPDGQRIVTGSEDKTARVWDASNGKELLSLKGHPGTVHSVAFSPDGQRIITTSGATTKVWETGSGRELLTLNGALGSIIRSIAFFPEGSRIVTASDEGIVQVWEAASAEQVAIWQKEEQAAAERLAGRHKLGVAR